MFQFYTSFAVSCFFKMHGSGSGQAKVAPKLVVFLHPSIESGDSEAWHSSKMHADHFINDCAYYCSKGFYHFIYVM